MAAALTITGPHGDLVVLTVDGTSDVAEDDFTGGAPIDRYVEVAIPGAVERALTTQSFVTTPVLDDIAVLTATMRERREALGLTQRDMARILGVADRTYRVIEQGQWPNYTIHVVQKICVLLQIRFNYLPFIGPPLREPLKIWQDIQGRALTLGLRPSEFGDYLCVSHADLKRTILSGEPLPSAVQDILTHKFHLRLLPTPKGVPLTATSVTELYAELAHWQEVWQMSDTEVSESLGCKDPAFFSATRAGQPINSYVTATLAAWFGYKLGLTHDELPEYSEPQYLNAGLAQAIRHQMGLRGFRAIQNLADAIGREHYAVSNTLEILEGMAEDAPMDEEAPGEFVELRGRDALARICAELKITLYTPETLPQETFTAGEPWPQALPRLLALIRKRRLKLRITTNTLKHMLNSSYEQLNGLEALANEKTTRIGARRLPLLERLLDHFKITIDPFERLKPLDLDYVPGCKELGRLLSERLRSCPISRARLAQRLGVTVNDVKAFCDGHRGAHTLEAQAFARMVQMAWPGMRTVNAAGDGTGPPADDEGRAAPHRGRALPSDAEPGRCLGDPATSFTPDANFREESGFVFITPAAPNHVPSGPLLTGSNLWDDVDLEYLLDGRTASRAILSPTETFITDKGTLCVELKARREALGMTLIDMGAIVGLTYQGYRSIERGDNNSYRTVAVQRACLFLKVRFDYLPYAGMPLREPEEILRAVVERALTLGLTAMEFEAFAGVSLDAMAARLRSDEPLDPATREILTEHLRLRIWPAAPNKAADTIKELAAASRALRQLWRASSYEMATITGTSADIIRQVENSGVPLYAKNAERARGYAMAIGFLDRTLASLQPTDERYYYDTALIAVIRARRDFLGITTTGLARAAVVDNEGLADVLEGRTVITAKQRPMLNAVCAHLKIRPRTLAELPTQVLPFLPNPTAGTEARLAKARQIVKHVMDLKDRLALSDDEIVAAAGIGHEYWTRVKHGDLDFEFVRPMERLAAGFRIALDPFEALSPIPCSAQSSPEALTALIQTRAQNSLVSHVRLAEILGVDASEVSAILAGRRDEQHSHLRHLCLLLKIHLPPLTEAEHWVQALHDSLFEHGLRDLDFCNLAGLTLAQLWDIKLGRLRAVYDAKDKIREACAALEIDDYPLPGISAQPIGKSQRVRHADLPATPEPQFYDAALYTLILQRMDALGLDQLGLATAARVDNRTLTTVLRNLLVGTDEEVEFTNSRRALAKVCRYLKIPVATVETLPPLEFHRQGPWREAIHDLTSELTKRRRLLRMSRAEIKRQLGIEESTLSAIEKGRLSFRSMAPLEGLLTLFRIQVDPFGRLESVRLSEMPTGRALGQLVRARLADSLISNTRLMELAGVSEQERSYIVAGRMDPNDPEQQGLRRLAAVLKIELPEHQPAPNPDKKPSTPPAPVTPTLGEKPRESPTTAASDPRAELRARTRAAAEEIAAKERLALAAEAQRQLAERLERERRQAEEAARAAATRAELEARARAEAERLQEQAERALAEAQRLAEEEQARREAKARQEDIAGTPVFIYDEAKGEKHPKVMWLERLRDRCQAQGLDLPALAATYGFARHELRHFGRFDPTSRVLYGDARTARLAGHLRVLNRGVVQKLCELARGDLEEVSTTCGLDTDTLRRGNYFCAYPTKPDDLPTVIERRQRILMRMAANDLDAKKTTRLLAEETFATIAEMHGFLAQSGGNLEQLTTAPRVHIYYLFSLGDSVSAAYHIHLIRKANLEGRTLQRIIDLNTLTSNFMLDYQNWLKDTYELQTNAGGSLYEPQSSRQRPYPVHQDRPALEARASALREIFSDERRRTAAANHASNGTKGGTPPSRGGNGTRGASRNGNGGMKATSWGDLQEIAMEPPVAFDESFFADTETAAAMPLDTADLTAVDPTSPNITAADLAASDPAADTDTAGTPLLMMGGETFLMPPLTGLH